MKNLFDNRYFPITDSIGFIQVPLLEFAEFELICRRRFNPAHQVTFFRGNLENALRHLEPLCVARVLLISTDSEWTAVFTRDPSSTITDGTRTLERPGLLVSCLEDTYDRNTRIGLPGGVRMFVYSGKSDPRDNELRALLAINGDAGWEFIAEGTPLAFENPGQYTARRIRDRFTPEMLEEYCLAMGIRLFDDSFYGPKCALIYPEGAKGLEGDPYTYAERQAQIQRAAYGPRPNCR